MPPTDWIARVSALDISLDASQITQLTEYIFLLRQWNSFVTLVSAGDLPRVEDLHLVDSLSLVSVVQAIVPPGGVLLDIGSGGGFPAIPLAVALPDRRYVLMERSAKKVSFLRKVMGALGLGHVTLIHGSFPEDVPPAPPVAITARAVERAEQVLADVAEVLPEGCTFLCQSGDPAGKLDDGLFHVEQIEDAWTKLGVRRGSLYLVQRRPEA